KGSMTSTAYFSKMTTIRDELAAIGKPVDDDEVVTQILNGLDFDYNPFVSSVLGRADQISLDDLYSDLLAYDARLEMYREAQGGGQQQYMSSADSASRGRGNSRGRGGNRG